METNDGGNDADLMATVPMPPQGRLQVAWGPGNQLLLASMPSMTKQAAYQTPLEASTIRWGSPSQNDRRITYETLPLYKELQITLQQGKDPGSAAAAVLEFSKAVSAILESVDRGNESGSEVAQEKMLWDLLELFFAKPSTSQGTASEGIAKWLLQNQAALSLPDHPTLRQQKDSLVEAFPAEVAPDFWPFVAKAAALGWVEPAVEALCNHSAMNRWSESPTLAESSVQAEMGILEPIVLLLRRMPRYVVPPLSEHTSMGRLFLDFSEFQQYRTTWQQQCREFLGASAEWEAADAESPSTAAGLRLVVSVLAGIEAALVESTDNWTELLVAHLLHAYPGLRPRVELRSLVKRCRRLCDQPRSTEGETTGSYPPRSPLDALPEILLAAAEGDVQSVIASAAGCGCSPWFLAHAPLLVAASPNASSILHAPLPALGGSQVEAYILEYAAALAPLRTTCRVAAEYLAWCPSHGAAAFESLVPTLPDDSALYLASRFQLPHLAARVRQHRVSDHISNGRSAAAVVEAAAAGEEAQLADALAPVVEAVATVLQSDPSPELATVPAVEQLTWVLGSFRGTRMPPSPSAAFVWAYHRLVDAWSAMASSAADCSEANMVACAAAMEALRVCPSSLWLPLAVSVTPLIDTCPPVFGLSDTEALLLKFQDVSGELYGVDDTWPGLAALPPPDGKVKQQQIAVVTAALSRNLARAFVSAA